MNFFIANLETSIFKLNAYGQTKELARQALKDGIESYALKYRLSQRHLGIKEADIKYEEVALGQCHQVKAQFSPFGNFITQTRVDAALNIARGYGGFDGAHHKVWVIDQMCRALLADEYDSFVVSAKAGEDGPGTYEWDVGLAP